MSDPILMGGATGAGVSQEGRIFCYPYIGDAMTQYEFHPLADIFPMLSADELRALAADIGANGLVDPITLHDGAILDGRNRYAACLAAGVDPRFTTFDGPDALAFVLAKNLHRRHLTKTQLATLALDLLPALEERAQVRRAETQGRPSKLVAILPPVSEPHKARDEAAALVGVSPRYVSEAKAIAESSPELLAGMRNGSVTMQDAKKTARQAKIEDRKTSILARESVALSDATATVTKIDALDFLVALAPESADLLLTDPPYMTDVDDVATFAAEWVPLALSRVAPTGRAYVFTGAYPAELLAYLSVFETALPPGWTLDNVLVWTYRNTLGPSPKMGYKLNWQACFYLYGPDAPPLDCPVMLEQFTVHDVTAPDGRHGTRYHTWQKPNELAERIIRHATLPGQTVVDPFAGTGTFLSAAGRLARVGIGAERCNDMLDLCQDRGLRVIRNEG